MRRKNVQSIGEVLNEVIHSQKHLEQGILVSRVQQNWNTVMGPTVASFTRKVYFYNGVLYVELTSSVARNELVMLRDKIVKALNESVGADVVKELVLR
jgi:predicted nucleic acid-binding Zn ribbon protein